MVGRVWIWVCILFVIIGMLIGVMLQVAEILIVSGEPRRGVIRLKSLQIVNTVSRYQSVMGSGGRARE